jgi:hypothetical protein
MKGPLGHAADSRQAKAAGDVLQQDIWAMLQTAPSRSCSKCVTIREFYDID